MLFVDYEVYVNQRVARLREMLETEQDERERLRIEAKIQLLLTDGEGAPPLWA